jgi:hypothetical protein
MRNTFLAPLLAAALIALAPAAHGFCIYNDLVDADVHATLMPTQAGYTGKVYREKVEPGKESCCNPKNAECNPDRVADTASIMFEAKVVPRTKGPKPADVRCGRPTANPRFVSKVEVPSQLRGNLRFEPNQRFNRAQPESGTNPRYILRVLTAQNAQPVFYACIPGAPA